MLTTNVCLVLDIDKLVVNRLEVRNFIRYVVSCVYILCVACVLSVCVFQLVIQESNIRRRTTVACSMVWHTGQVPA